MRELNARSPPGLKKKSGHPLNRSARVKSRTSNWGLRGRPRQRAQREHFFGGKKCGL